MPLDNEIAIVTGGGHGIGEQIALRLAREGAALIIADIDSDGARKTAAAIASNGGREATVIPTDISDEIQVSRLVQHALTIYGRIDILVNNAGIMGPVKNVEDITLNEWNATLAVNLTGLFLCC
jgi:NAD(P)-dependent dehydrogenase (short-subunit alcohol dehydrogenase family)